MASTALAIVGLLVLTAGLFVAAFTVASYVSGVTAILTLQLFKDYIMGVSVSVALIVFGIVLLFVSAKM